MHKVPFMLWSPLYLPKCQPGRYDVHNIFTLNWFQLAFQNLFLSESASPSMSEGTCIHTITMLAF